MSQFAPPDASYADPQGQMPRKTSGLAIWSLVCSLIFCCPVTTIIGILLGIGGFFAVGANPALKGRGLAVAGIIIGLLATAFQFWGGNAFWKTFMIPVMEGPKAALVAGFAGDTAGFKSSFYGPAASATDAEAAAYIESLRGRFGEFQSCRMDDSAAPQPSPGTPSQVFPYILVFSNATVDAEAEIVFVDQATGQVVMKPSFLTVFTDDGEEITFPPPSP